MKSSTQQIANMSLNLMGKQDLKYIQQRHPCQTEDIRIGTGNKTGNDQVIGN